LLIFGTLVDDFIDLFLRDFFFLGVILLDGRLLNDTLFLIEPMPSSDELLLTESLGDTKVFGDGKSMLFRSNVLFAFAINSALLRPLWSSNTAIL